MAAPVGQLSRAVAPIFSVTLWLLYSAPQVAGEQSHGAVFLREFTLIRRESLNEDFLSDLLNNNNHKIEDTMANQDMAAEKKITFRSSEFKFGVCQNCLVTGPSAGVKKRGR